MRKTKASRSKPSKTVSFAAEALRADSLSVEEGALIGSEDELLERHNVSRPTLRKAAAMVAQEQLLQVRRGVGGGYIARRPTSRAVTHMAALFLRTRGAGLEEIIQSVEPIRVELARLAAIRADETTLNDLRQFLQKENEITQEGSTYRAFLKGEREFGHIVGRASRNTVLSLYLEILYDLAASLRPEYDIYLGRIDRIDQYRARRNMIAEAIIQRDPDIAMLASKRCSALGTEWMMEDLKQGKTTKNQSRKIQFPSFETSTRAIQKRKQSTIS